MSKTKRVKVSSDGNIDFVAGEAMPASLKKFRQSPEIEGFYRFISENDLRVEAYTILEQIVSRRKAVTKKAAANKA